MPGSTSFRWVIAAFLFVAAPLLSPAGVTAESGPALHPGAIELGVSGSLTSVEGVTTGLIALRGGYLFGRLQGVGEVEWVSAFSHVSSLDTWDLEAIISWHYRVGDSGNYPFASIGGGLRHESVGSFGLTRYPVGFGVGLKTLIGPEGGIRVEYQFRRVLNDTVSNVNEHRVLLGISLFFLNR